MLDTNSYFAERLMDLRVQEERHQAGLRRLPRMGLGSHQGWLSRQSHKLVCQLGSLFVSLGVRLLHVGLPQPHLAGKQMLSE